MNLIKPFSLRHSTEGSQCISGPLVMAAEGRTHGWMEGQMDRDKIISLPLTGDNYFMPGRNNRKSRDNSENHSPPPIGGYNPMNYPPLPGGLRQ